jgi:formylglycine-generating enzyme required for sulfatase activity
VAPDARKVLPRLGQKPTAHHLQGLAFVPAGEFVMGSNTRRPDEQPPTRVRIDRPFWMGKFEVTNQQYALLGTVLGDWAAPPKT